MIGEPGSLGDLVHGEPLVPQKFLSALNPATYDVLVLTEADALLE